MDQRIKKIFQSLEPVKNSDSSKALFYANFGNYDRLDYPIVFDSAWDIYLFVNEVTGEVDSPFIVREVPDFGYSNQNLNRIFKILAHNCFFSNYEFVAYSDANVVWLRSLDSILLRLPTTFFFYSHNKRQTVDQELRECLVMGKLSHSELARFTSLSSYSEDAKLLLGSSFVVRPGKKSKVPLERWYEYYKVASRDQLGLALLHKEERELFTTDDFAKSRDMFSRRPHKKIPYISRELSLKRRTKIWMLYIISKLLNRSS